MDDDCNPQTGDGDADGDGHWSDSYETTLTEAGLEPLSDPNGAELDCWDDVNSTDFVALSGFDQLTAAEVSPSAVEDRSYDKLMPVAMETVESLTPILMATTPVCPNRADSGLIVSTIIQLYSLCLMDRLRRAMFSCQCGYLVRWG